MMKLDTQPVPVHGSKHPYLSRVLSMRRTVGIEDKLVVGTQRSNDTQSVNEVSRISRLESLSTARFKNAGSYSLFFEVKEPRRTVATSRQIKLLAFSFEMFHSHPSSYRNNKIEAAREG